jgi:hypothetical protein
LVTTVGYLLIKNDLSGSHFLNFHFFSTNEKVHLHHLRNHLFVPFPGSIFSPNEAEINQEEQQANIQLPGKKGVVCEREAV